MINKIFNSKKGMTLFISIIVMGILLFISFAVVGITLKATFFSSSGRDSQYAFYAADAGLECAIYWDSKEDSFSTSTPASITCAGQSISTGSQNPVSGTTTASLIGGGGDSNQTSVFGFSLNQGSNPVPYCAIVTVRKYYEGANLKTYIKSRGYNTCNTSNSRRVERGVEATY